MSDSPSSAPRVPASTVQVSTERWQSRQESPVRRRNRDKDDVMDTLAGMWGPRVTPGAARQRVRRAETVVRDFAVACHRHGAGARLLRFHALSMPVPPDDQLSLDDWQEHGAADRLEDSAREDVLLSGEDTDELRRYERTLRQEIHEKMQHLVRVQRRIAAHA